MNLNEKMKKSELIEGGVLPPGTAAEYETGGWRSIRPVWMKENCIQCMFCWIQCPDSAVTVENGQMTGFNLKHCKGCGICARECPGKKGEKAIKMVSEKEFQKR